MTSMPSATRVTQAGSSLLMPFTSTRHSRQAPTVRRPGRWHSVGMEMPFSRATSRIVWSSRAPTSRPSMVRVLTRTGCLGAHAVTSSFCLQVPAGQPLPSMCASYSSRK